MVRPDDTEFRKLGTLRPGAEEGETAEKERVTQAVPAAVEVEELGDIKEATEEMEEAEEYKMEEEDIEEREREARYDRDVLTHHWD